ncbi:hypothetical protein GXB81_03515 [Paraburkholderia sp. Ac-20336]|uniref:hypothetical protein n=1 Tax=Burkholderiaceae TaxID=119060 RepID=UPI00142064CA|nr:MULTISPECIES: hypothetical protein [Burkholderiaceae]MBN3802128.1 hypothetical protein [Paraburkholderia sp. Ac-20336]NIF54935.1 hypothetical protein [Burkholderia sp. Ax-1724]
MPHPISTLGACHTIVSLVPFVAGLYSFVRYHGIDSTRQSGRIYLGGLVVSVLTSFGLSSTGGFNAGHALGILALLAIGAALLIPRISILGRARAYLSQFGFTFSFFLLLVPGINETLTRLPVAHPLAEGPASPLVRSTLAAWLGIFVVGAALQYWWMRSQRGRVQAA